MRVHTETNVFLGIIHSIEELLKLYPNKRYVVYAYKEITEKDSDNKYRTVDLDKSINTVLVIKGTNEKIRGVISLQDPNGKPTKVDIKKAKTELAEDELETLYTKALAKNITYKDEEYSFIEKAINDKDVSFFKEEARLLNSTAEKEFQKASKSFNPL